MGIFDFLKKSVNVGKSEKEKIKKPDFTEIQRREKELPEKINFSWIGDFIKRKNQINKEKEKLYLGYLEKKKHEFIHNIENQLEVLGNVDLEYKKAKTNDRVKGIVQQNKDKYIQHVETVIEKLQNLATLGLEDYINKANKIFSDFYNKSSVNYEKATVLIGNEIGESKKLTKEFSEDVVKAFKENKNLINEIKIISGIKSKYANIQELDSKIKNAEETIKSLDEKISNKKQERQETLKNIEKIKNSENYKKRIEKQEQTKNVEKQINNLIFNLKQEIDFKELANFFHIFPKKIKIVKGYKENFSEKFKENRQEIIDLLHEAGLKTSNISEIFENIKNKESELQKIKNEIPKDETFEEHGKLNKIDAEIDNLKNQKSEQEKRKNKIQENKQKIKNSIKSDLNKIDVELKGN